MGDTREGPMERSYELRIMGEGKAPDTVKVYADQREAEREYRRLVRAKAPVTLACRLPTGSSTRAA